MERVFALSSAASLLGIALATTSACGPDTTPTPSVNERVFHGAGELRFDDDGLAVLSSARLEGRFGLSTVADAPATEAHARRLPELTELYFDRTDDDGTWSMVQLFLPGPGTELLPAPGESVVIPLGDDDRVGATGLICSQRGTELYDRAADEAELSAELHDGAVEYELRLSNAEADATARFSP